VRVTEDQAASRLRQRSTRAAFKHGPGGKNPACSSSRLPALLANDAVLVTLDQAIARHSVSPASCGPTESGASGANKSQHPIRTGCYPKTEASPSASKSKLNVP
jgi:hypothetical protein